MKDKLTTNVHSEQVAPPDAKHLLSAVPSRLVEVGQTITTILQKNVLFC